MASSGKNLLNTALALYALAAVGQPLLLLSIFVLSGLATEASTELKVFWWIVIVYSLARTIVLNVKKKYAQNAVWHLSYLIVVGGVMLYREQSVLPEEYFTTYFQIALLIASALFPPIITLLCDAVVLLRTSPQKTKPNKGGSEVPVPIQAMEDNEMEALLRQRFSQFLHGSPDTAALESEIVNLALKSGDLKWFVDEILLPESARLYGAFMLLAEETDNPLLEESNAFSLFLEALLPKVLALSEQVPGYLEIETESMNESLVQFLESAGYNDRLIAVVKEGMTLFAHDNLKRSGFCDLRGGESFSNGIARGIVFSEPVYAFVEGVNVHEAEKMTEKEYTGTRGYSVGTTLRFGSGIPPLRLGTYRSKPQYTTRTRYKTTFDMTGTLYCTSEKLLFANQEQAHEIPFDKILRLADGDDLEDAELNVVLDRGVTWCFGSFPNAEILLAFKEVVQAAIAACIGSDRLSSGVSMESLIPYALAQAQEAPAKDGVGLEDGLAATTDYPAAHPSVRPNSAEHRTVHNHKHSEEVSMPGSVSFFQVSKKSEVTKLDLVESNVSATDVLLKWVEDGQRRPSLVASSHDGIHYEGAVKYPTLEWRYNSTLTRYSNESTDLLLGYMEGEGERYVCWFELPKQQVDSTEDHVKVQSSSSERNHVASPQRSAVDLGKVALVSRDYSIGPNGCWDFSPHFKDILKICDASGCETVLFSPYSLDKRGIELASDPFANLSNVNIIVLEQILTTVDDNMYWEDIEMDNLVSIVLQRSSPLPIKVQQRFASSQDSKSQKELFVNEIASRQFRQRLLMICGETNIISTGRAGDAYHILQKLDALGTKAILNPIHDYMRRYEMKEKRALLSKNGRFVASVWNTGKGREPGLPWTLFYDGGELSDRIILMEGQIPNRPDILIGIFDCASIL